MEKKWRTDGEKMDFYCFWQFFYKNSMKITNSTIVGWQLVLL